MQVRAGFEAEYRKRHRAVWPDLLETFRSHGVREYSIFLDQAGVLFGYVVFEDEDRWNAIASTEICQQWWEYMEPLMPTNGDSSPISETLEEVFRFDFDAELSPEGK